MAEVFPLLGYFSSSIEEGVGGRYTRVFKDGSYRTVLEAGTIVGDLEMKLSGISEDERAAVKAVHQACMAATSTTDFEVYVYNGFETDTVDPAGAATTGRHTAIFLDEKLKWSIDGKCRYSTTVKFHFLD